ncbi:MAG: sulfatase [Myxococcales bacterium]|nr:sulfatase [Myxococcales bacterium]MDH3485632.1 sulfatase [Myxococcales bacterium]
MKSRLALIFVFVLSGPGCSEAAGKSELRPAEAVQEEIQAEARKQLPLSAADPLAATGAGTSTYMDLVALSHLADVYDPAGLFIDFGTASRLKYTNGNWNSGWRGDLEEGGQTVSTFGKTARLYLPMEGAQPVQLRIRAKAYVSGPLITYLNGKTLKELRASTNEGFVELVVPIPSKSVQPGENAILFRATKTRQVRGKARSFAVDWVRLEAVSPEGETPVAPIRVAAEELLVGGVNRRSIRLAPGAQADWFVEVPKDASLMFGVATTSDGAGALEVGTKSDRKATRQELPVQGVWSDHRISLTSLAGDVVQVRFRNSGSAGLALSNVRITKKAGQPIAIDKPARNVIVLLIDTLRASKLAIYNPKTRVKTPALDTFAAEGVVFERPQAPENWTKPSVASVLTSLHPVTHNTKEDASKLPKSALMLSEVYQKAGFETGSFIANGYVSNAFGFDQGWDHYTNYIRERRNTNASNVFGEAASWIEKNKDKRFFAYIQTIDPHVPYDPPDKFLKMYDPNPYKGQVQNRRTHLMLDEAKKNPKKYSFTKRDKERIEALHDGEISYHDEHFGKFLVKLRELGLDDDTLIVITSDHGEEFQEHGSWGHGHSVYQELLGVPLLFRWPGVIPAGARVGPVVSTTDIAPTVLEATGVPIPREFEGHSLMGFIRGDWPMGPYVAFSDFLDHRRVIRGGDWKLIIRGNLSQVIFDLESDPWEQTELDGRANPITQRYLRTLHGQFLGAQDRGKWLAAETGASGDKRLSREKQEMTPELCRQLVALGYISAECDQVLSN